MSKTLGNLPAWDLSDLYEGTQSSTLEQDLKQIEADAADFIAAYQGKVAELSATELADSLEISERIDEGLSKIMSYAQLLYAEDMSKTESAIFYQNMQEKVSAISSGLIFYGLELNKLSDEALETAYQNDRVRKYQPFLRDIRQYRDHQLSPELEKLFHEKSVTGRGAWNRLFDETIAELRFTIGGQEMGSAEALDLMSSSDGAVRKEAAEEVGRVFGQNIRVFSQVTNVLAKDKEIEDTWRGYKRSDSSRNLSNCVEDEVVDALFSSVKEAYPSLSHRYYRLKAKWFGVEKLAYYDRNAPLPNEDDRTIPWEEAEKTVLEAYGRFSPKLADVGRRFFENPWIDAPVRDGKSPGAFAHPTVPSAHPYLLVNYQGKVRDVMTLAHELGHGVHQVLAGKQGHYVSDTPLTLAETASVFGEMLTFQSLLAQETDPKKKKALLAGKVEDMLNTVVRQIAFYDFEKRVHAARREGEISAEKLGEIWLDVQEESLGDALEFGDGYQYFWAYIPHFIHSPFYVYAYAFGDCLVNSLYALYQQSEQGFAEKYLQMLSEGGAKHHKELLAPFGLDASNPDFWKQGLNMISGFIDELEQL